MLCPREKREAAEALLIGPHGLLSVQSTGRPTPEAPCQMRTCFQRDVDRITATLKQECSTMRLYLIDHVVVTDSTYYSYSEEGKL